MSKQERVELHLHTTVSDDVSVITPKETIDTAVKLGHKAVAVTNLNPVQDFLELEECQRRYGNNIKVIYGAEVHYAAPLSLPQLWAYGFCCKCLSGYDLPSTFCPCCGERMYGDGHNIPDESSLGCMARLLRL